MDKIKFILFDMDGTLVDTEPVGPETLRTFLSNNNINITQEEWELFDKVWRRDGTDMSFEVFMERILSKYSPEKGLEVFISDFYLAYEENIITAEALPGVSETLSYLKEKYKLAVVTASTKQQVNAVLKKHAWEDVFDVVLSHDDFKKSKPDPESFLTAAGRFQAAPEDCVVIEDSKNGSLAGKNAGMIVIGVRAGNKHDQDLSAASIVVDTMSQVKDYL